MPFAGVWRKFTAPIKIVLVECALMQVRLRILATRTAHNSICRLGRPILHVLIQFRKKNSSFRKPAGCMRKMQSSYLNSESLSADLGSSPFV